MNQDQLELLRPATYHGRTASGGYRFSSSFTPESCNAGTLCQIPPKKVVPIIFVPGIMGSNLQAKKNIEDNRKTVIVEKGKPVWRVERQQGYGIEIHPKE